MIGTVLQKPRIPARVLDSFWSNRELRRGVGGGGGDGGVGEGELNNLFAFIF